MMTSIQFGDMKEHASSDELSIVMTAHARSVMENRDICILQGGRIEPYKLGLAGVIEVFRAPLSEDDLFFKKGGITKKV